MTCIIAMKSEDGSVWLAGDKMGSDGHNQKVYTNTKVFQVGDFAFGTAGSIYMAQLIKYSWEQPAQSELQDTDNYIFKSVVNSLKKLFKDNGFGTASDVDAKTMFGEFIMTHAGRIFVVQADMSLLEVDDFATCGSGSEVANGAMEALMMTDMVEEDILNNAINIASKHCSGVSSECDILQFTWEE